MSDNRSIDKREKTLVFAWWNTGLSPSGKPKQDVDLSGFVSTVVKLVTEYKADFIALAEISSREIDKLCEILDGSSFQVIEGFDAVNGMRSKFSQAYIVNSNNVAVEKKSNIVKNHNGRHLKVGQRLELYSKFCAAPIDIIASHWPSSMNDSDDIREACGYALRATLDNDEWTPSRTPLILLGDYNHEPFHSSIAEKLLSSRDIALVRKRRNLLYNPFWKEMGSCRDTEIAGSYYYRSGRITSWYSFDCSGIVNLAT
ncbi:MAG: hypothetical protein B7X54_06510 [Idiomarina sp. 34-48-12]|nr:MAG: hypothetical protein B7X54_06510 [Idiomarina sp. 34-48-12]